MKPHHTTGPKSLNARDETRTRISLRTGDFESDDRPEENTQHGRPRSTDARRNSTDAFAKRNNFRNSRRPDRDPDNELVRRLIHGSGALAAIGLFVSSAGVFVDNTTLVVVGGALVATGLATSLLIIWWRSE
jgi:hypothetical protein